MRKVCLAQHKGNTMEFKRIENLLAGEEISCNRTEIVRDGKEQEVLVIGEGPCKVVIYKGTYDNATDEEIISSVRSGLENKPELNDVEHWTSWDYARHNVRIALRPRSNMDDNKFVKRVINEKLEVIYRIFIPQGTIPVPVQFLERWKLTENELYLAALMNVKHETSAMSMSSILGFDGDMGIPMIVFSTNDKNFGSSSILNTEELERVAQEYDDDLFIIPSSVHECIITPAKKSEYDALKQMIVEVNESQLRPEEVLADYPFYYSKGSNKVNFEPRIA